MVCTRKAMEERSREETLQKGRRWNRAQTVRMKGPRWRAGRAACGYQKHKHRMLACRAACGRLVAIAM